MACVNVAKENFGVAVVPKGIKRTYLINNNEANWCSQFLAQKYLEFRAMGLDTLQDAGM